VIPSIPDSHATPSWPKFARKAAASSPRVRTATSQPCGGRRHRTQSDEVERDELAWVRDERDRGETRAFFHEDPSNTVVVKPENDDVADDGGAQRCHRILGRRPSIRHYDRGSRSTLRCTKRKAPGSLPLRSVTPLGGDRSRALVFEAVQKNGRSCSFEPTGAVDVLCSRVWFFNGCRGCVWAAQLTA
jgi:hypothetical protein